MLHDPRLLLLDEPFTGLDGTSAAALAQRLRALAAEGRIVVMATHEVEFADDVLTRAVILRDGRVAADVPGGEWRNAYRDVLAPGVLTVFLATAWAVFRKDVLVETRSRELVSTTLVLRALVRCSSLPFALVREGRVVADAAAGILWIAIAFAGTLALGRTFERERYTDTLRALLLAPAPRAGDLRRQARRRSSPAARRRSAARAAGRAAVRRGAARSAGARWPRCC